MTASRTRASSSRRASRLPRSAHPQGLGHVSPTSGRCPGSVTSWFIAQIARAAPCRLWNRSRYAW